MLMLVLTLGTLGLAKPPCGRTPGVDFHDQHAHRVQIS
jgi:hypothetical protein